MSTAGPERTAADACSSPTRPDGSDSCPNGSKLITLEAVKMLRAESDNQVSTPVNDIEGARHLYAEKLALAKLYLKTRRLA